MLYVFHGSDEMGVRRKAFAWIAAARAKAPDAYYIRLNTETITPEALREAVAAQGLFFTRTLVTLDDPFARAESRDAVIAALPELATSPNVVAVVVPKASAKDLKQLLVVAEKDFVVDAKPTAKRGFNSALVNALAARDGMKLWLEIRRAYAAGDAPELVHGLLHWKARDLMDKAQQGSARGWTFDQARGLSRSLIELLSESRGRGLPLELSLERFSLNIRPTHPTP